MSIFKSAKRSLKKAFSLPIMGAITIACSLWLYTSLNSEYSTKIEVPLTLKLPDSRSPENVLPSKVTVLASGTGWNLFNVIFFNKNKVCYVDLSSQEINEKRFEIDRSTLKRSIINITSVSTEEVYPENLTLITGATLEKRVPLLSRVRINTLDEYITSKDIFFNPDSVIISGNEKIITKIKNWNTEKLDFNNIKESFSFQLNVSDSLNTIISVSTNTISATVDIQQKAERTFYDIPLEIVNGQLQGEESLIAEKINITLRGGVQELLDINTETIKAKCDISELRKFGVIFPEITYPNNFKLLNSYPTYIELKRYTSKLARL
ncbi:MAG: hypothetical protein Kapaf2KO_14540 [Candidatus Kapaibacteriales bacterium]